MEKFKLNLQLFANPNTNTTGDNTQGNDLSPTMKTFYNTSLLENSRAKLFFNQFGKEQGLPKNGGNKVEFRKFDTFKKALTPLTEGVTPDGNKVNLTKKEAEIEQYGDYTTISDRLELEAVDSIIVGVTEEHGAQAGETLDTLTRNVVLAGTQVQYANGKSSRNALTASDVISGAEVAKAATQLKKMKAPTINNDYVAIIHPSVTYDLRQDNQWLEAHKYARPEEIYNGEIGKLHGVRFVETTEEKVFCGEDLISTSRTLTVNTSISASSTVKVNETLTADELAGRYVQVGTDKFYVSANTTDTLTLKDPVDHTQAGSATAAANSLIYPGEGGKDGVAVYATIFMGKDAYGRIKPSAESLEVIVKQRGSAGTSDPLDQRSTVGWKASHASIILYEERLLRLETGSTFSAVDEGN